MDDMKALSNKVRETAHAIHVFQGNGHGLLINLGSYKYEIQKYIRNHSRKRNRFHDIHRDASK